MNLFLALTNYGKNVQFTTVWEQGHTQAERSGDADDNFISWIAQIEGVSDGGSSDTTSKSSDTTDDNDDEPEVIKTNSNSLKLNIISIIWLILILL